MKTATIAEPPDVGDKACYFGFGPWTVIRDFTTRCGDPCSCVVRHYRNRDLAVTHATNLAAKGGHVRVEHWPSKDGGERIVQEWNGPSPARAAFDDGPDEDADKRRTRPGGRLTDIERTRRVRLILAELATGPKARGKVASRLGFGDSSMVGTFAWGLRNGLWVYLPDGRYALPGGAGVTGDLCITCWLPGPIARRGRCLECARDFEMEAKRRQIAARPRPHAKPPTGHVRRCCACGAAAVIAWQYRCRPCACAYSREAYRRRVAARKDRVTM